MICTARESGGGSRIQGEINLAGVGINKETDLYRLRFLLTEKNNYDKHNWHQSAGFKQRSRIRRRYVLRDLFPPKWPMQVWELARQD